MWQYAPDCIGTDYWRNQTRLENPLDGGTAGGCATAAVINALSCVECVVSGWWQLWGQ